jgi:hypothetical protein
MNLEENDLNGDTNGEDGEIYIEHYTRPPAKYVAPPAEVTIPNNVAVVQLFAVEHDAGEMEVVSAYAFGGPRHQPPYRLLHDIEQPDQADVSGWAENLRWAFEPRACF